MIFAEMKHQEHYADVHSDLVALVSAHFAKVQSGLQGDSWIWIMDGEENVSIDTFTSHQHQLKSAKSGAHVQKVIEVLRTEFELTLYDDPEPEAHEDT